MGTQKLNLAVIIKNPSNDDEFLITKQNPPPKFNDPDYDSYPDSDLWDLPSVQLSPPNIPSSSKQVQVEAEDNSLLELLKKHDLDSAVNHVLGQVGLEKPTNLKWHLSKVVEEPEFGPGNPMKTVYIVGKLETRYAKLEDCCKWMSTKSCADLLLEVKGHNDRIGPLVVAGLLNDSMQCVNWNVPATLRSQEYPPGVRIVPMRSRTTKPFHTTNLVVFAPRTIHDGFCGDNFIASGDALIIDPGCSSAMHKELEQIITALPGKLVVFVTHHHHDHVDGLSIVQKCNPDATLLAHENTFSRIMKDDWSLGYIPVLGSEEICIGGQRLRLISAPGHTDGHLALLHVATNSLIVGDHCVGQGSALLDITSGGNMNDYYRTTYKFMELSPHVLIPMHGRVNMWPKHMLCGYLKNRRNRESTILKAIEDGAKTLFDIVAYTYADVDRNLWIPAASNVQLHVDHLAQQNKLPKLVQWGKSTMIDAERRLLANALLDFTNERFVLLSETCIPLFNFSTIYDYLINSEQSFLSTFDDPRPIGRGRYNKDMGPTIESSDWRKGSQWFEANRELALAIVSDVTYYPMFKNFCLPPCYADEHYLPTLVTKIYPNMTSNRSITWTDWSQGGSHPRMIKIGDVTQGFLERIRNGLNCTYNGEMTTICYLFARKFHHSTLQPLFRIAPKLLGFNP